MVSLETHDTRILSCQELWRTLLHSSHSQLFPLNLDTWRWRLWSAVSCRLVLVFLHPQQRCSICRSIQLFCYSRCTRCHSWSRTAWLWCEDCDEIKEQMLAGYLPVNNVDVTVELDKTEFRAVVSVVSWRYGRFSCANQFQLHSYAQAITVPKQFPHALSVIYNLFFVSGPSMFKNSYRSRFPVSISVYDL